LNLALGAVLLAILLIPPLIFFYFYNTGSYAKAAPKMSLLEYLLVSAVLSLLLHSIIIYLWRLDIDFNFLFRVLTGQITEDYINKTKPDLTRYFSQFSLYIFKVCTCAALGGWLLGTITTLKCFRMSRLLQTIRNNEFPQNSLRYYNKWWYYFRAYQYKSEYQYLGSAKPNTYINLLVDTKDASVLYEGTLVDWVADGEVLDRVYISTPTKRLFNKKNGDDITLSEGCKMEIESDGILCIPYCNVINMHIQFIKAIAFESDAMLEEDATVEAVNAISEEDLDAPTQQE
jgi:hypothetical protein